MGFASSVIPMVVVGLSVLVAGVVDAWTFRVPNVLTVPMLISGLIYHAIVGGLVGLQMGAWGMLFGFGIVFVLYLIGAMGAGDVKLMAAVGAWLGMPATLYVFVVAALATAVYSFAVLLWQGGLSRAVVTLQIIWLQMGTIGRHLGADERVEAVVRDKDRRQRLVPFAVMVALGVIAVLVWSRW